MLEHGQTNIPLQENSVAAIFDVDGTLAASNILQAFYSFQMERLSWLRRVVWAFQFLPKLLYYAILDVRSRSKFNEVFYQNYSGLEQKVLVDWANQSVARFWVPRLFPGALECIKSHRDKGHKIFLVSGTLDVILEPLARWVKADGWVGAKIAVKDERYTGVLVGGAVSEYSKVLATHRLVEQFNLDLAKCFGYADSFSDLAFLESVGYPVAVHPDRRLKDVAGERGWPIKYW